MGNPAAPAVADASGTESNARHDVLAGLGRLAEVHDRPDLAEAAAAASRRLTSTAFRIVVAGEFKRGKSSLVNALIDAPVSAVDDDIATAARLEIGFADPPAARRWWRPTDGDDGAVVDAPIPVGEAAAASTDPATRMVRVGIPRRLLARGVVLVDTPGVGGIGSANALVTASTLGEAHAVLFVTDVSQELTAAEASALVDATRRCRHVVLVETKTDLYPHWRTIVDTDRGHLDDLGLSIPIVPVSNQLRSMALRANDSDLNAESGFPRLIELITGEMLGSASEIVAAGADHAIRRISAQLRDPLVRELEVLEQGHDDGPARAAIDAARNEVAELRARAGTWQQILSDGMTDLGVAVDVDLRDRMREIVGAAEADIDEVDPDLVWDTFEADLYRRTAEVLDGNLELLRERADAIAHQLAVAVEGEFAALDGFDLADLTALDGDVDTGRADRREGADRSSGARAQQAFRAGYGGAMPIMAVGGMALGVLGLGTLVLPLAAVAGVLAGRRAVTDERERRLQQRRQQARVAVKKYIDETMYRAANERKQAQRKIQRTLRDHFGERVKELAATHQQRVQRAEAAAAASEAQRRERLTAGRSELARIDAVVRQLHPDTQGARS